MAIRSLQSGRRSPRPASWGSLIGTLLLLMGVVGGMSYLAFPLGLALGWLQTPAGRVATFLGGAMAGELVALVVLLRRLQGYDMTSQELGWGRVTSRGALALGVLVAMLYSGFTALNPRIGPHLLDISALKLLAIVAALAAGVVEETIFRGYVMTALARMGYGRAIQVLVSGASFAFAHLYGFTNPVALLVTQGLTFVLGAALAATYLVGKRSLTPVIIAHALVDLIVEPWLLLSFFTPPGR